ncbi:MAG: hypothetical protein KDD89_03185 [Anaerolineales bacterium]|nr:hypothetical protein [Anaerolineales bacterium]
MKQITDRLPTQKFAQFSRIWWLTAVVLLLVACQNAAPNTTASLCSGTGLCVAEVFQPFYQEYGGERIFGQPHREAYTNQETGRIIQYFDNVRLEYDRQQDRVIVTDLGAWALEPLRRDRPDIIPSNNPAIEDAFGDFYATYNGPVILGAPLTNQIEEGQLRVQYFERGRLEWHPEAQVGRQVQLTQLGQSHFMLEQPNPGFDIVAMPDARAQSADVTAAVSAPILYRGDTQILYVIAEDANNGIPLSDLVVTLHMTFSDGTPTQTQTITQPTNSLGLTQTQLDLPELTAGTEVQVLVEVAYPDEVNTIGETITTFQTWW